MKSATVFLMALTVFTTLFLESSTAPADSTINVASIQNSGAAVADESLIVEDDYRNKIRNQIQAVVSSQSINNEDNAKDDFVKISQSEKQYLNGAMLYSQNVIARASIIIQNALLKAKGNAKKNLNEVNIWTTNLLALAMQVRDDLRDALDSNSKKSVENISAVITQAVAQAEAEYEEIKKLLAEGIVKNNYTRQLDLGFANAEELDAALKGIVARWTTARVA